MKIVHNKPATPSVIINGMKATARSIRRMTNTIAMAVTAPIMIKMIQEIQRWETSRYLKEFNEYCE
jgi:UDP-N-acetylenolpyruvoylglucosamine reductase